MTAGEFDVRVVAKRVEAVDICSFELARVDGEPLPAFSAGSHVDVHLPGDVTRQYSLCNDPTESHRYLIAVLRDAKSRGGSAALHDRIGEGQTLRIGAPKNHFPIVHGAAHHLLLAGGIGVTPLLCMAERLAVSGASFEMHYCTRSRERTAFVERIRASTFTARVVFHHDDGPESQRLAIDGVLDSRQAGTHVYVCGPKGFMDAVLGRARALGWPDDRLHSEFFGAEVATSSEDAPFEVQLSSSGRIIVVAPDRTAVQALADAGVDVPVSCEQGVCGTCLTRVIAGEPDHRDLYLTPEEQAANDQFLPCCSRARSPRLVLDL